MTTPKPLAEWLRERAAAAEAWETGNPLDEHDWDGELGASEELYEMAPALARALADTVEALELLANERNWLQRAKTYQDAEGVVPVKATAIARTALAEAEKVRGEVTT